MYKLPTVEEYLKRVQRLKDFRWNFERSLFVDEHNPEEVMDIQRSIRDLSAQIGALESMIEIVDE